jgi:hypothetical protein
MKGRPLARVAFFHLGGAGDVFRRQAVEPAVRVVCGDQHPATDPADIQPTGLNLFVKGGGPMPWAEQNWAIA